MDDQVDEVIAEGVFLDEIPVQGKREIGDWAVELPFSKRFREESGPEGFREEVVYQEGVIFSDIGRVVEVPRNVKCIAITKNNQQRIKYNCIFFWKYQLKNSDIFPRCGE